MYFLEDLFSLYGHPCCVNILWDRFGAGGLGALVNTCSMTTSEKVTINPYIYSGLLYSEESDLIPIVMTLTSDLRSSLLLMQKELHSFMGKFKYAGLND